MAIIDKKLELFDAQSLTGMVCCTAAALANTTSIESSILDLGTGFKDGFDVTKYPDIGEGGALWLNVHVPSYMDATSTGTLRLYTGTTYTCTSGTLLLSKSLTAALATGASAWRTKIPAGTIYRYLQLVVVNGFTTWAVGSLDAWISLDSESDVPSA